MPCSKPNHNHDWPTEGTLTIERCEVYCEFCTAPDDRAFKWKLAWFVRRHVREVHIARDFPNLTLSAGW